MCRGPFRPGNLFANRSAQADTDTDGVKRTTSASASQAGEPPSTATTSVQPESIRNSSSNAGQIELSQHPPPNYDAALSENGISASSPRLRQRWRRPRSHSTMTQTDLSLETAFTSTAALREASAGEARRPYHSTLRPNIGFHENSSFMSTVGTQIAFQSKAARKQLSPVRRTLADGRRAHVFPRIDTGLVGLQQQNENLSPVEAFANSRAAFTPPLQSTAPPVDIPQIVDQPLNTDAKTTSNSSMGTSSNAATSGATPSVIHSDSNREALTEVDVVISAEESSKPAATIRQRSHSESRPRNPVALPPQGDHNNKHT